MAPSKTYNIPGLGTSFAVIPDAKLRTRLVRASRGIVAEVNALGYAACEAAYRDGEPWRLELLAALRANRDHLLSELPRSLPGIRVDAPIEATYLAWLDVGALGLDDPVGHFEAHGVGLSEGADFGVRRGSAVRLNFGCPRPTLEEALRRIRSALGAIAKRTPAA
jgi:cystathionine beta-lyase